LRDFCWLGQSYDRCCRRVYALSCLPQNAPVAIGLQGIRSSVILPDVRYDCRRLSITPLLYNVHRRASKRTVHAYSFFSVCSELGMAQPFWQNWKRCYKLRRRIDLLMKLYLTATGCHLPYAITVSHTLWDLPPDTSEHTWLSVNCINCAV